MHRTSRRVFALSPLCLVIAAVLCVEPEPEGPAKEVDSLPLLFHEDFSGGDDSLKRFEFTDPAAWQAKKDGDAAFLSLVKQSKYQPPVRSPVNIAWVKDLKADVPFILEVKLRSTTKDYGHRDLCLFFGGTDPSHFFYVHIAKAADDRAHSIFLVDGKPRVSVAKDRTKGTDWDDAWHRVRVVRKKSGRTDVFWEGERIMSSDDASFPTGRVGVGSFDDTGDFDEITVWGQ